MIEFDKNPPKSLNEMKLELATKWQERSKFKRWSTILNSEIIHQMQ